MAVILNLPYKSQCDPDADASRNDCGPVCLAMLINAFGLPVTTDAVFRRTGAQPDQYVTMAQLVRAGESYGVPLEYRAGLNIGHLRGALNVGRPLIAMVHYGAFSKIQPGISTQSTFTGPHFLLVVGYDDEHVIVHDPLWYGTRRAEGAFKKWPNAVWQEAWERCHEDGNPDCAALISVRTIGAEARAAVAPDLIRRIRAKAAYQGHPLPDLAHPASLNAYVTNLGDWGRRTVAHVVRPTDTLWQLAKAYYGDGGKMDVIRHFNGLTATDVIYTGQVLFIPEPTLPGIVPPHRQPQGTTPSPAKGGPRPPV